MLPDNMNEAEWEAAWDGPPVIPSTLSMLHGVYTPHYWTDIDGRRWTLAEMSVAHRANALRFIRKRAQHIADSTWWTLVQATAEWNFPIHLADEECSRITTLGPAEWLETTPLVSALRGLVEADEKAADRRDAKRPKPRRRRTWAHT